MACTDAFGGRLAAVDCVTGIFWSTLEYSRVPLHRPMQLPPELLELTPSSRGGYTLRRNESVKTMDPAASDVWAAGHILLWLVGIRALQVTCLAYPLSAPRVPLECPLSAP